VLERVNLGESDEVGVGRRLLGLAAFYDWIVHAFAARRGAATSVCSRLHLKEGRRDATDDSRSAKWVRERKTPAVR
jgi:hypothetical protein